MSQKEVKVFKVTLNWYGENHTANINAVSKSGALEKAIRYLAMVLDKNVSSVRPYIKNELTSKYTVEEL